MNVLIWATTFGADLWSLARHLIKEGKGDVRVVMRNPDAYIDSTAARMLGLSHPPLDHEFVQAAGGYPDFSPDITVMDNLVPHFTTSAKGFMFWHGYGWRGPNDRPEMAPLYKTIEARWGDPTIPNSNFRWQCFGPVDFAHRTAMAGLAPENCVLVGAASHDDLVTPLARGTVQSDYPFDLSSRKTVLFAPTWHYEGPLAHWGDNALLLETMAKRLGDLSCNLIIRMHDSHRYDQGVRSQMQSVVERHPHVLLKYKNHFPGNYADMQVSDLLITNFSSIANLFYATGRPTVHIYPVEDADAPFEVVRASRHRLLRTTVASARSLWKFPLECNGGLIAHSFEELLTQVEYGLDNPDSCRKRARAFLDFHMMGADGHSCERAVHAMQQLIS